MVKVDDHGYVILSWKREAWKKMKDNEPCMDDGFDR